MHGVGEKSFPQGFPWDHLSLYMPILAGRQVYYVKMEEKKRQCSAGGEIQKVARKWPNLQFFATPDPELIINLGLPYI